MKKTIQDKVIFKNGRWIPQKYEDHISDSYFLDDNDSRDDYQEYVWKTRIEV